jgi:hypothetical protein
VKEITLSRKIYGYPQLVNRDKITSVVEKVLIQKINELVDCPPIGVTLDAKNRVVVKIEGRDEDLIANMIIKEFGKKVDMDAIEKGKIMQGSLKLVGKIKFGLFVDVGIEEKDGTQVDVLIRKNVLEEQLLNGRSIMIKKMSHIIGFLMDYIPVEIEITDFDKYNRKIEGKFSEGFIQKVKTWMSHKNHLIFVTGVPRQSIKRTLAKAGFSLNIESIERIGFLENIVRLFDGTNAPGVIAKIGRYVEEAKLGAFIPDKIKKEIGDLE